MTAASICDINNQDLKLVPFFVVKFQQISKNKSFKWNILLQNYLFFL